MSDQEVDIKRHDTSKQEGPDLRRTAYSLGLIPTLLTGLVGDKQSLEGCGANTLLAIEKIEEVQNLLLADLIKTTKDENSKNNAHFLDPKSYN